MSAPFEFCGFPRKPGEDICEYVERYNSQRGPFRPVERAPEPPREQPRLPYREPREPGEEG